MALQAESLAGRMEGSGPCRDVWQRRADERGRMGYCQDEGNIFESGWGVTLPSFRSPRTCCIVPLAELNVQIRHHRHHIIKWYFWQLANPSIITLYDRQDIIAPRCDPFRDGLQ